MLKGRALKQHSDKCVVRSGLDSFALDGRLNNNSDDRKAPPKLPADISQEMRAKTEEFAIANLSVTPKKIWWMVKNWANKEYERNWFGLCKDQVKNLAKKARTKLGFGNFISTVESVPEYRLISDTKQPFLHCSATFPHPVKTEEAMRIMIYANPALLGLLQGVVDIYVDATFKPCIPYGFYQCLILVVLDNQTSSYVPIVYALMSHKNKALYNQVFFQIKCMTKGKMEVRTYTSDFERAEMNMLAEHFPKGIHVGCLFHFKQALVKYLKDLGLGCDTVSFKPAIKVGGLDILCVLPRYVKYYTIILFCLV